MNAFLKDRLLPGIMICSPLMQTAGMYVSINLHGEISMPGFLLFPIIAIDTGITNILVFTMASAVHNVSHRALTSLRRNSMKLPGMKLSKRQMMAFSNLKIKFGSNFIDRGTPLVMQNFCINQTMSLTLIKSGRIAGLDRK